MPTDLAFWLFWLSVALIAYTYFGFPLLLYLRARFAGNSPVVGDALPPITVIIAAHNEAPVIQDKLANTLALDYPPGLLEIIVASDGSDDGTDQLVRDFSAPGLTLISLPRGGKNAALNAAVAMVKDPERILLFTDADTTLDPAAARLLAAHFAAPEVGGVGGDFHYYDPGSSGAGELSYWSLDRWLKTQQSRGGNLTSATGQIYALRRHLYQPCPPGVTDDFFISTGAIAGGMRLVFEPRAHGSGPVAPAEREFDRKVRISSAGFAALRLRSDLLNPFKHGFYAVQLLTHKVLRRMILVPLVLLMISAPVLWADASGWWRWFYGLAALGLLALQGAALAGWLLRGTPLSRSKLLSLPLYFDMVNIAAMIGLFNMLRGIATYDRWNTRRDQESS